MRKIVLGLLLMLLMAACREPVQILGVTLSESFVSPNADGNSDAITVTVIYSMALPGAANSSEKVNAEITFVGQNENGSLHETISGLPVATNSSGPLSQSITLSPQWPDGTYELSIYATIRFSNGKHVQSESFSAGTLIVDTAPPVITSSVPTGGFVNLTNLQFVLNDLLGIQTYRVLFNGELDVTTEGFAWVEPNILISHLPEVVRFIPMLPLTLEASDYAGNSTAVSFNFFPDFDPPTISMSGHPVGGGRYAISVVANPSCEDVGSGIAYAEMTQGEMTTPIVCGETIDIVTGPLTIRAVDYTGNEATLHRDFEVMSAGDFVDAFAERENNFDAAIGLAYAYENDIIVNEVKNDNYNLAISFIIDAAKMETRSPEIFLPALMKAYNDEMVVAPLKGDILSTLGLIDFRVDSLEARAVIAEAFSHPNELFRIGALEGLSNSKSRDLIPALAAQYQAKLSLEWVLQSPVEALAFLHAGAGLTAYWGPLNETSPENPPSDPSEDPCAEGCEAQLSVIAAPVRLQSRLTTPEVGNVDLSELVKQVSFHIAKAKSIISKELGQ